MGARPTCNQLGRRATRLDLPTLNMLSQRYATTNSAPHDNTTNTLSECKRITRVVALGVLFQYINPVCQSVLLLLQYSLVARSRRLIAGNPPSQQCMEFTTFNGWIIEELGRILALVMLFHSVYSVCQSVAFKHSSTGVSTGCQPDVARERSSSATRRS